jgi:hypothetical protein
MSANGHELFITCLEGLLRFSFLRIIRFLVSPRFTAGIRQLQYFKTHQGRGAFGNWEMDATYLLWDVAGGSLVRMLLAKLASFSSLA